MTCADIRHFKVPVPPPADQKILTEWIAARTGASDTAIGRYEQEIVLLREYRNRLIADVVTGKLDVREAAAKLPEMIDLEDGEIDVDQNEEESEESVAAEDQAA